VNAQPTTFSSTYTPRLDDKGRLTLPAAWRHLVEDGIVLTRGQDHCVFGLTPDYYNSLVEKVRQLPFTHPGARKFSRMFFSGAAQVVPDKQGRVAVPQTLRDWGGLDRDCAVVGVMDRFEIWNAEKWNQFEIEGADDFADGDVMPGFF